MALHRVFTGFLVVLITFAIANHTYAQDDLLTVGMKAFSNGRFVIAEEALETAYRRAPNDFRVTYWLAQTYKAQKRHGKAEKFYLETIELYPSFPPGIYIDLADVALADGGHENALRYIEIARKKGVKSAYLRQMEGVALLNLEKHEQAMLAFQDVAATEKGLAKEATLYMGLTQQATRNLEAAERSFRSVLELGREDDLSVLARRQMGLQQAATPQAHKPFSVYAGMMYQRDSNPTVKPNDDTFVALANIQGHRDYAKILTLGGGWQPKTTGPWGIRTNYDFYGNKYDDFGSQDVASHNFTVAPFYGFKEMSLNLPLAFNYTEVDHKSYLRQFSLSPTLSVPMGDDYLWQLTGRVENQNYATQPFSEEENRDNNTYGLNAGVYWFLKGQDGYINLRVDAARTNADGDNWDRATFRFSGFLTYPIIDKLSGQLSLSYTIKNFDNIHSTAFVTRDDDLFSGTAGLRYEVLEGLDVTLSHTIQNNDSNVVLYDYDRDITSFGLQKSWRF